MLAGYVFVDIAGRDIGSWVEEAKRASPSRVTLPAGYRAPVERPVREPRERVKERLKLVVPLTLFLIVVLLYLNTGSAVKTSIVLLAVPFSAIGAIWLLFGTRVQRLDRDVGGADRADGTRRARPASSCSCSSIWRGTSA